jgi:hypothetical protein
MAVGRAMPTPTSTRMPEAVAATTPLALVRLLQLVSPSLPVGAFT